MPGLKPCPFCGTVPTVVKRNIPVYPYAIDHGPGRDDYQCLMDYMVLGDYSSEEKAIRHWNRRVGDDKDPKQMLMDNLKRMREEPE